VSSGIFIILGIGNIGNEYVGTRHNAGFDFIDKLLEKEVSFAPRVEFQHSSTREITVNDNKVLLVKPNTYVNLSGIALDEVMSKYNVEVSNILVIVDDFHLPLGKIRIRKKGSSAGHNGMKSIISYIGDKFARVRIGIGPLPEELSVVDFVLGKFSNEELEVYIPTLNKSLDIVRTFVVDGIDKAMNQFNS